MTSDAHPTPQLIGMPTLPPPVLGERRKTRQLRVGSVGVGSEHPISVQSMTTTVTADVNATLQQIAELTAAGCDIVRVACPSQDDPGILRGSRPQPPSCAASCLSALRPHRSHIRKPDVFESIVGLSELITIACGIFLSLGSQPLPPHLPHVRSAYVTHA
ncbi:GcpE protein [Actinokineospora iranica]|uniref:GcpE protein n=1 Tax=Actinokineospora iranica TaxID=1271860 RepID=A0A1G6VW73_9PSEU|nr:GcpE protein [Actinokineospora iranica]